MGSLLKKITAVVLSPTPYVSSYDEVTVLNHICPIPFQSHYDINTARRKALAKVTTPYCFFLDSDDQLPEDYVDVLQDCVKLNKAVVYTQELIKNHDGTEILRQPGIYSQDAFIRTATMMHHLVLYNTVNVRQVMPTLPDDRELLEVCLNFQMAKISVGHVPRVGYIWNRGQTGMHAKSDALEFMCRAAGWCARNRT